LTATLRHIHSALKILEKQGFIGVYVEYSSRLDNDPLLKGFIGAYIEYSSRLDNNPHSRGTRVQTCSGTTDFNHPDSEKYGDFFRTLSFPCTKPNSKENEKSNLNYSCFVPSDFLLDEPEGEGRPGTS